MGGRFGRLGWELALATRILRSRSNRRLSTVTWISILGIVFGVTMLTLVSGITAGFQDTFRQRILGLYPHLLVMKRGADFQEYRGVAAAVREAPGVVGASPATFGEMLASAGGYRTGMAVKGVDVPTVRSVTRLDGALLEGSTEDLSERPHFSVSDGRLLVDGLVENTTWTAVLRASGVVGFPGSIGLPTPGLGGIRLVTLDAHDDPVGLRLRGAAEEPAYATGPARPTRALEVVPKRATAELIDRSGAPIAELPVDVSGGVISTIVAERSPDGPWQLRLLPPLVPRSGGGEVVGRARLRVVNDRSQSVALGSQPEGQEVVAAGVVSDALDVPGRPARILLGIGLRDRLHVGVGDIVSLVSPLRGVDQRMLGPSQMAPSSARFEVAGWFQSGFWEYDVRLGLVSLEASQRFVNRGDVVQWIDVRFDNDFAVRRLTPGVRRVVMPYGLGEYMLGFGDVRERLDRLIADDVTGYPMAAPRDAAHWLDNASVSVALVGRRGLDFGYRERFKLIDWEDMNHNLLSALRLQKVVLTIFFLIVIVVAAFNIVGSQVMLLHEKQAEIAILKSMGATGAGITRVFFFQGLAVSGAGTLLGLLLGLGLSFVLSGVGYPLDPEVYLIDELPVAMNVLEALTIGAMALLVTLVTTSVGAMRAGKLSPVRGLRRLD